MKAVKRVGLEVVGWLLLVAGIAALVLPGPGLLMIFASLAILSQQYEWAERRLDPIKYRALKGAAESVENVPRIIVSVAGVLFLVASSVLWFANPAEPEWWPLPELFWLPGGGPVTGATLAASAVIAAGLIVYAYQRFHGKPHAVEALEGRIEEADREYDEMQAED